MAKIMVSEKCSVTTAHFMVSENYIIVVPATEIIHIDGYIVAFNHDKISIIFNADKVMGCWLEGWC